MVWIWFLEEFGISPADKGTGFGLVRMITLTWAFPHEGTIGNILKSTL